MKYQHKSYLMTVAQLKINDDSMVENKFEEVNVIVKPAEEDVDRLIPGTALELSPEYDAIIIFEENINLLFL